MRFAKRVFLIAAIYGFVVLVPQYFLEQKMGLDHPPAITHPEYFYGFAGVALAWQVAFLIISADPARYRTMMLPGVLEKVGFGGAVVVLYLLGRVQAIMLIPAAIDLVWGVLFAVAYVRTAATTA